MPTRANMKFDVKDGHIDEVQTILNAIIKEHRGMVGCLGASIEVDKMNNTARVSERWGAQPQHEYQMTMLANREDYKRVLAALESEPEITYEEI